MVVQFLTRAWEWFDGFMWEHGYAVLIGAIVLLGICVFIQAMLNSSLEEDLIEVFERIEEIEKQVGIEVKDNARGGF